MLYCSVGIWTGLSFNKVGEGLCPRGGGSSAGMLVQTSALGSDGDLFVGGALLFLVVCICLPLIVMGWSGEALIVMYLLHVVSVCALRVIHSFDLFWNQHFLQVIFHPVFGMETSLRMFSTLHIFKARLLRGFHWKAEGYNASRKENVILELAHSLGILSLVRSLLVENSTI
jgi:hypothetical protein